MPKTVRNALTDVKVRKAAPKEKDYKLTDGEGLYLLVAKSGGKRWRYQYRFEGKQEVVALGTYPAITLSHARRLRDEMREKVATGISPAVEKRRKKEEAKQKRIVEMQSREFTFEKLSEALMEEWLKNGTIGDATYKRNRLYLVNDAFPVIGDKLVGEITPNDVKIVVGRIDSRGRRESARKLFYTLSKIFRVLVTRSNSSDPAKDYRIEANPCASIEISDLLGDSSKKNYPTITDEEGVRGLLLAIDDYTGDIATRQALRLMPYTALRPANIRFAEWNEIDLEAKLWKIPAAKMKTRNDFTLPLTDSMIRFLEEIRPLSGHGRYVFPSYRDKDRPLSDNTLLGAIRRLGYTKEQFTPHGFRAMFSTVVREKTTFKDELIEAALAHSIGSGVSQRYNRAEYIEQRRELMQWWSDWLDGLKERA